MNELYKLLKGDISLELKVRYEIGDELIEKILDKNKFDERFVRDPDQFDCFETDELALIFYETYKKLCRNEKNI